MAASDARRRLTAAGLFSENFRAALAAPPDRRAASRHEMGGTGKKICEKMMGKVRKRNEPASNPQWRTGNRKVIEGCRRSIKQNGGGKIMRIQSIILAPAGVASLTRSAAHKSELQ